MSEIIGVGHLYIMVNMNPIEFSQLIFKIFLFRFIATKNGSVSIVKKLLENNAFVDIRDDNNLTPLFWSKFLVLMF